jgi:hypothetical protein
MFISLLRPDNRTSGRSNDDSPFFMKELKDHFSALAPTYATFRPRYPCNLYHFLYENISQFQCAWDCGTGNGQVAEKLSEKFSHGLHPSSYA